MPVSYTLMLGGILLGDVHEIADSQRFKHGSRQSLAGHGGVTLPGKRGENSVRVRGELREADLLTLRNRMVNLDQLFSSRNLAKLVLADDGRFRQMRIVRRVYRREAFRGPSQIVPYELDLQSVDPFWYASAETVHPTQNITVNPTTVPVTNQGSKVTPCRIAITPTSASMPAGSLRLTNTTTGETWKYTAAIVQDTPLVVDSRQRTATNQNQDVLGSVEGFLWDLAVGANNIKCEGSPDFNVAISWHERWGG